MSDVSVNRTPNGTLMEPSGLGVPSRVMAATRSAISASTSSIIILEKEGFEEKGERTRAFFFSNLPS
jgi:hypothetical protein